MCNALYIVVSLFVHFLLAIVLSVLRFTNSDYPFWYVQTLLILMCYVYYLYLFAYYKWYQPRLDLHIGSPPFLVRSVLLILLTFCVMYLCFVCLRPVFCVSNVASGCGLSILDCSFGFLYRLFYTYTPQPTS
jgi:hypothetical protein